MPLSLRTMMVRLPRRFSPKQFHRAVDLGDDRRVLRLAGLEDFGHARQTARDVLRARHFARRLGQQRTARNLVPFVDFDMGLFRQVVKVEDFAALVFQHDLRVEVPLVLHDQPANVAAGVLFGTHRFAFDDVFVANLAANFGQNRNAVRVPGAQRLARLYLLVLLDHEDRARGHFVLLQLAALGIHDRDFAVAREHDVLSGVVAHDFQARELNDAFLLGLALVFDHGTLADAADVERSHRQLRARLADALRGDDADGHALFDQRTGRKIHAIAQSANTQRRIAGQSELRT